MNVANVIPLGAPRAALYAKSERQAAPSPVHVRFGAFELDEPNALLLHDGTAVALAPRPFELLCALARRPGSLLTKHALLDEVWGHQFVSDSVLKTAVSEVRSVLDDDPREPRFIETVSRRGYRFIAPTGAIFAAAPFRPIDVSGAPSFEGGSGTPPVARAGEYTGFSRKCLRCPNFAALRGDVAG
ncbi:MAG TPA: winged helix-turn-helix domain-containing protein [Burkholderiaceae bacterium]|nr:winged helix-turn-helix domain-containing protein [Burkholderiaceae bacterium]